MRPNIHPGEILAEEFLKPSGVKARNLACALHLPCDQIDAIIAGRGNITADTALRLSHYFGTSERFWLEAQMVYDLECARRRYPWPSAPRRGSRSGKALEDCPGG